MNFASTFVIPPVWRPEERLRRDDECVEGSVPVKADGLIKTCVNFCRNGFELGCSLFVNTACGYGQVPVEPNFHC